MRGGRIEAVVLGGGGYINGKKNVYRLLRRGEKSRKEKKRGSAKKYKTTLVWKKKLTNSGEEGSIPNGEAIGES